LQSHQMINQDSGDTEYYTPESIVMAARRAMGGVISLDPATSHEANRRVKAEHIYTADDDGLTRSWFGNVWMNHPFSKTNNRLFVAKLVEEYQAGRVKAACCITFAATSEKWFRPLLAFPQCYIYGRTNYHLPNGTVKKGVTKGSVVTYLGPDIEAFRDYFEHMGAVKI